MTPRSLSPKPHAPGSWRIRMENLGVCGRYDNNMMASFVRGAGVLVGLYSTRGAMEVDNRYICQKTGKKDH
jgi:hypothetical protein